jgi:hypothetical protein
MMFDGEGFGLDKNSDLYKLFKLLNDFNENHTGDDNESIFGEPDFNDNELGEPDSRETTKDGNITITVDKWFTEDGEIKHVHISGSDKDLTPQELQDRISKVIDSNKGASLIGVDLDGHEIMSEFSLEEQLERAVAAEKYELAARLRDDIKNRDELVQSLIKDVEKHINNNEFDDAQILLSKIRDIKSGGYYGG